jgi:hypothetical protein
MSDAIKPLKDAVTIIGLVTALKVGISKLIPRRKKKKESDENGDKKPDSDEEEQNEE